MRGVCGHGVVIMKRSSEEESWEDAVADYLRANPDYFARHEDLLEALSIPHVGRGAATSLLEKQVALARLRVAERDRERQGFLAVARDNDALAEKLHRLAVALIDAASLDDVLGSLYDLARTQLALDVVTVVLGVPGGPLTGRSEFVAPDDARLRFALSLSPDRPLCGPKSVLADARSLLGPQEGRIASIALVPLRDPVRDGVMIFGSLDRKHFVAGSGTLYLSRLGELAMRAIARFLNA